MNFEKNPNSNESESSKDELGEGMLTLSNLKDDKLNEAKSIEVSAAGDIEYLESDIKFLDDVIEETGGVEGYRRQIFSWEEVDKIVDENINTFDDFSSLNKEDLNKVFNEEITPQLTGAPFVVEKSGYHIMRRESTETKEREFYKKEMLRQKPFDPRDAIKVWRAGYSLEQAGIAHAYFHLFDRKNLSYISPELSFYEPMYDDWGCFNAAILESNVDNIEKRIDILNKALDKNIACLSDLDFYTTRGLSLAEGSELDGTIAAPGLGWRSQNSVIRNGPVYEFNFENNAFQRYCQNVSGTAQRILDSNKRYFDKEIKPSRAADIKEALKVSIINEAIDSDNSIKNVFRSLYNESYEHPKIPIMFGDFPSLHWAHCNRAVIPTQKGINLLQTVSSDE